MPAPQNAERAAPPPREAMTEAGLADLHQLIDGLPLQFSDAELTMIWDTAPPVTNWLDFKKFVYIASVKQLNPLVGDLHMEYRNDRASGGMKCSIVTHIEAVRKICARSGLMDGFEQIDGADERGPFVETILYVKNCRQPFKARAYFSEFVVTRDDKPNYIWSKMGRHMTAKCSEKYVRNIAFPEESAGLLIDEEMPLVTEQMRNSDAPEPPPTFQIGEKPAVAAPPAPTQPVPPVPTPAPTPAPVPPSAPTPTPAPAAGTAANPTDEAAKDAYKKKLMAILSANKGLTKEIVDQFYLGYFGVDVKSKLPREPQQFLEALAAIDTFIYEVGLLELIANPGKVGASCKAKAAA